MKRLFFFSALFLSVSLTFGQGFTYQSIVRNASGEPQAGLTVFLKFDILDGSPTGTLLYSETQEPLTDAFGWFSVVVGSGAPIFGNIADVNWNNGPKYLKVECGEAIGGPYAEIATSQINYSAFRGPQGIQGVQGIQGDKGDTGPQGMQGPQGVPGPQGETGPEGPAGNGVMVVGTVPDENSLDPNYAGNIGDIVITEDNGSGFVWNGTEWVPIGQLQGPAGAPGMAGPAGPQGEVGPQGQEGPEGMQGVQGAQGAQGPQGIQGLQGPQGAQGVAGPANSLAIGTVMGGATASATITGTPPAQTLNLVLPEGPQGIQGPQGAQGPQGPQGPAGPAGSYTAGTGINIAASVISAQTTTALWNANQLQGRNVASNAPTQGFVLKWFPANTMQWEAAPDNDSNPWTIVTGGIQYQGNQMLTNEIRIGGANGASLEGSSTLLEAGLAGVGKVGLYTNGTEWGPTLHNTVRLGSTSFRWSEIWSVNGLNQSSDERLKKDIIPLSGSLDKIVQMNPVSYRWKKDDGHTHLGFLAQELENVIPEVVRKPDTQRSENTDGRTVDPLTDTYAVNYSEIIPVLVKAIQEQQEIIRGLESRIKSIEEEKRK